LDEGLGPARRTEVRNLWAQPVGHGGTAKQPGLVRMMRVYRDCVHDVSIVATGT
jgi:hypothetical protein